ncbi:MAG: hypothetical protein IJ343_05160, partial [Clostridia bacterium]|nr:hypothetical protein [Clostridia bacterium]
MATSVEYILALIQGQEIPKEIAARVKYQEIQAVLCLRKLIYLAPGINDDAQLKQSCYLNILNNRPIVLYKKGIQLGNEGILPIAVNLDSNVYRATLQNNVFTYVNSRSGGSGGGGDSGSYDGGGSSNNNNNNNNTNN